MILFVEHFVRMIIDIIEYLMKEKINSRIKICMGLFLFGCLFKMPYDYYELMRLFVFFGCIVAATRCYFDMRFKYLIVLCLLVAILYNPILPIHLTRSTWQPIDIFLGCAFTIWGIYDIVVISKNEKEKRKREGW